jgi:hypothetical protein
MCSAYESRPLAGLTQIFLAIARREEQAEGGG